MFTSNTKSENTHCQRENTSKPLANTSTEREDMLDLLLPAEGKNSLLEGTVHEGGDTVLLQGWYEWTRQRSWDRDYKAIENAFCGKAMKPGIAYEYYRVHIFPRRASLLESANEILFSPSYNCSKMMKSIATAAPLMVLGKKL
jgi:hypothetical protein